MKREYFRPHIEIIVTESLLDNVQSYGQKGSVTDQTDTDWGFGGDGNSGDTPDAKGNNIWDEEDDIW